MFVCVCMHMYVRAHRDQNMVSDIGTGVAGSFEMPDVGTGNCYLSSTRPTSALNH